MDPLIRHTYQTRKPLLDEWDYIVHMCDDPAPFKPKVRLEEDWSRIG